MKSSKFKNFQNWQPLSLLIIELVARAVPARLIIRQMERQMLDKLNFLHHPRLTSVGEGKNLS